MLDIDILLIFMYHSFLLSILHSYAVEHVVLWISSIHISLELYIISNNFSMYSSMLDNQRGSGTRGHHPEDLPGWPQQEPTTQRTGTLNHFH